VDSYAHNSLDSIRLARESGLIVVGDVEWSVGDVSDQLRNLCHHLVVPLSHARSVAGTDDPRGMLDALWAESRVAVVITCGDQGVYLRFGDEPEYWHQPAFSVEAVDTTGCGDCFHGAYETGLNLGHDLLYCAQFAAAAAAIAAEHQGGQASVLFATRDKVQAMLDSPDAPEAVRL
jgi:sugar/nucleoside kinase (ribokinase family)